MPYHSRISKNNIEQIKYHEMTPQEMIQFLNEGALFRSFSDVLKKAYPYEDLSVRLTDGLAAITGKNQASVARNVRNWMSGKNVPQSREQLFRICFVLGLGEAEADRLIVSASEMGIHYRNPVELVYAFALRTGRSYEEAQALRERMLEIYREETANPAEDPDWEVRYTKQIRREFDNVATEEDLEQFFRNFSSDLGEIHETAYKKFTELLDCLQNPREEEKKYSIGRIVSEYFRMHVPTTRKTGDFTELQKVIKKNWPSESELMKMKNRSIDVSRKALLLLFLITEDFEISEEFADWDDNDVYFEELIEEDADERLEIRLNKIDLFLESYGMNRLDFGSPFDCMVLYALRTRYGDEGIRAKIDDLLKKLFDETDD